MKFQLSVCKVLLFLIVLLSTAEGHQGSRSLDVLDSLLSNLQHEKWTTEEGPCLESTVSLLKGVKNQTLWATWIWNSMQQPVGTFYGSIYHLGNFDQCLQVPWSSHPELEMQYCLVDVKLADRRKYEGELTDPYDNAVNYIGMETVHGTRMNVLSLGVCLPSSCEPSSIAKITRHLFQMSYLPFEDFEVDPRDCQRAGDSGAETSTMFYLYWFVLILSSATFIMVYIMGLKKTDSTVSQVLYCFCPTRNFDALVETGRSEVMSMHGMRALTGSMLIVLHYFVFANVAVINFHDVEKTLHVGYGSYTLHLDACVDTFFVMSGLLHMKGLVSSKYSNWFNVLFKRYLRLVPTYALAVATFTLVYPHMGSGPLWARAARRVAAPCQHNWWRNLLMLTHADADTGQFCIIVSWYICCDYQLTVFGTLLFLLYKNNKRRGFFFFCLAFILSVWIPVILTYRNQLPGLLMYDLGEAQDYPNNKVFNMYVNSYARSTSYLVGVAMGYLMSVYKPQEYRKSLSRSTSTLAFMFGFSLMLLVLRIGARMFNKEYGEYATAVYSTVDRGIVWPVGICIIIAVCEYGTLPIINDLLSSKVFVPLSKLSYLNYMIHSLMMFRNMFSLRAPITYDFWHLVIHGLGYVLLTNGISYVLWFVVEAPTTNLVNLLFEARKSSVPVQKSEVTSNGVKKQEKIS